MKSACACLLSVLPLPSILLPAHAGALGTHLNTAWSEQVTHGPRGSRPSRPNAKRVFNACKRETACSEDRTRHRIHELEAATPGLVSHEAARLDADSLL